ncbi:unnamed protein product [Choristocarpus tenellus]
MTAMELRTIVPDVGGVNVDCLMDRVRLGSAILVGISEPTEVMTNPVQHENRARVLTEDELFGFYVDMEDYEYLGDSTRHDHAHLSRNSLDEIALSVLLSKSDRPDSVASTNPMSRSSSADDCVQHEGIVPDFEMMGGRHLCWDPLVATLPDGDSYSDQIGNYLMHTQKQADKECRKFRLWGSQEVVETHRNSRSCTSTKTYEFTLEGSDVQALAQLGVMQDTPRGLGVLRLTFTLQIARHRVVSEGFGRHAQFEVRLEGGNKSWVAWQRFSEFKMLTKCVDKSASVRKAWQKVKNAQPRFRCLDASYLSRKCRLLEMFLQQVMFAMPSPLLLIHFVNRE